ncbi:ATP-dependent RNA helicase DED1 [Tritrichomonas foetus]|uniref:RNA helicase n=1 Tax=Tritrichomonas foetus TaxID=1144522 RepID=A0A1J4J3F9_9EUKA|nr:ATP-dependent RNA helicase DED1 [Tritrichomonas foetus]|eukprot:OHS93890.1 ATP-dependent RNA helicase DED1 [Tritrichomonas foetus]
MSKAPYVPPHLRAQQAANQSAPPSEPQFSPAQIIKTQQQQNPYRQENLSQNNQQQSQEQQYPAYRQQQYNQRSMNSADYGNNRNKNNYNYPNSKPQSNFISDEKIIQMFNENTENTDMSVYEDAQVVVHSNLRIDPISEFPCSGIDNQILFNVAQSGYKFPTSVQKYAIPYIFSDSDLIVTAQTGSGKTAAFMLPVITKILNERRSRFPYVVVLVPTRELAIQIYKETQKFCTRAPIKSFLVYGGEKIQYQINQLRYGCDILIATPGRLIDIMERNELSLRNVKYLILDEADRMLDMGFDPQIRRVINEFDMPPPDYRQTLLFSATFPEAVQDLAQSFMKADNTRIEVGIQDAPSLIEQRFIYVSDRSKLSKLMEIIGEMDEQQTLVFAERRNAVDNIEDFLFEEGCHVVAIHGERDMENRQAALRGFTTGRAKIMVATDVAARGLDIPNVAHIINLDLPTDLDTYTHRIGRTGRAGNRGLATSFWNENNTTFLNNFINHLHEARLPIPEGLEEFEAERSSGYRRRGGRGAQKYSY